MTVHDTSTDLDAFADDWREWHRGQEERLADPHGFLAVTGLHWLSERPERFPDAPGAWSTGADGVLVVLDEGEELVIDGVAVRGEHRFGVIPERSGITPSGAMPSSRWPSAADRTSSGPGTRTRRCAPPSTAPRPTSRIPDGW
ncbi:hypothetical protein Saso_52450 [Streptomyces asoensis]|uniref:Uncharacterized protein n=1 Tax=Streptomyces asoensis TaxID=249586 RepID=A0ABQ3S642_9ACTN|nr:hypothetical protein GCM10010496_49170 [Streptomyces asoensis]GHI63595.1 hypothetical protein Saso_52450 [Streptomyces asoensis]